MPRFTAENYAANQTLLSAYNALAQDTGCSPAQLALAWLLHKAPHIIPIPGTTSVAHLLDDLGAVNVSLSTQRVVQLDQLINQHTVLGARYNPQGTSEVDTEMF
jgi:aryl-alcohol dehydrogenase-like predicted oxidoreductase